MSLRPENAPERMNQRKSQVESILIATLGTEPQVVTAALDLLLAQDEIIRQAVVAHTLAPGTPVAAAVETLAEAFRRPPYAGQVSLQLQPIPGPDGAPLDDVDTPDKAQAAFRLLYREVWQAKKAGLRVHLCIAGGRKTLAVFGMATAQLLFDEDDRLWHLHSSGEFLASRRLHPTAGDEAHLLPIPVLQWSTVSPMLLDLAEIDDPYAALERQRGLRLRERMEEARAFVHGALTPAEGRVVSLLVREGLSDAEIAGRLSVSPRTVEQQLRAAYQKAAAHWELAAVSRAQLIALLNLYFLSTENTGNSA